MTQTRRTGPRQTAPGAGGGRPSETSGYHPPRAPRADEHPGMANYPADDGHRPPRRPSGPSANRFLPPLDDTGPEAVSDRAGLDRGTSRVTVTRAARMRGREMGGRMYGLVHRAATADGADRSGLTALTWPVVVNSAVDAAMAVALANTLFFAAAAGESRGKVALYLVITIAPFAVIAPLIGPALDRLQHGRRVALAASFAVRTVLGVLLLAHYDGETGSFPPWVLYPCALGMMVLSKSFSVLRSAVTPRVMPPSIDLVRVNSRLTMFALLGGTVVGGGLAAGAEAAMTTLFAVPGALVVLVVVSLAGIRLSMAIPRWVEVTEGEVPASLSYHGPTDDPRRRHRQPLGRTTITSLWGNCTVKAMVGFLFLYPAFVARAHSEDAWEQLMLLGVLGAAAGVGNVGGNAVAARSALGRPALLVVRCTAAVTLAALVAGITGTLPAAAAATFVTAAAAALAKASLDASLQDDLPEESRASAFGRSETLLQLSWVLGGAIGVLVYTELWVGFTAMASLLLIGLAQTVVSHRGASLVPGLGGNRPVTVAPPDVTARR